MKEKVVNFIVRLGTLGLLPTDTVEEQLKKKSLTFVIFPFVFAGFLWGGMYFALGFPLSGSIPGGYAVLSLVSLLTFFRTKNYPLFRSSQLLLILLLPFLLQWSLGGFVQGSAVMLWAIVGPLGALTFADRKQALDWFLAYLSLTLFSGIIDSHLPGPAHTLTQGVITLFFVMNIGGVFTTVFFLIGYFIGESQKEHARAENLLLNILPGPIVERLKENPSIIADAYPSVTVLFADIVDFTVLSSKVTPTGLVEFLNRTFSEFDRLAEKHKLEKIKTIGDAYMVAGGIPEARADHAQAIAEMALDMLDVLRALRGPSGEPVNARIGINSGSVVAGVIGKKKFIYDLWGDAVNMASRMESHGIGGAIQVTEATYQMLKDQYLFEKRGRVQVKGKGEMVTYILKDRKSVAGMRSHAPAMSS